MDNKLIKTIQNYELFAKNFLVIREKNGQTTKFIHNRAQKYVNEQLDNQLKAMKIVRALILKGRQQGMSTNIQGRFFHRVVTTHGTRAFVFTHESEATKNLFGMTNRFYENLPKGLCPQADKVSAKELYFKSFDSGYSVGTAGNKSAGRGQTIQLFHGSELAYWPHAEEHTKGILQAIPNEPGTEIILESTANGIGNIFHQMWKAALTSNSEYQAIFVPWYWQPEYQSVTEGFRLSEDEEELFELHRESGITLAHLAWRRLKIAELSSDPKTGLLRFKQEYPFTSQEAFLNPIDNVFMNAETVYRAMQNEIGEIHGKLLVGLDPAIGQNDRCALIRRRGRKVFKLQTYYNHNTMEICGLLVRIIKEERPHRIFVDMIGIGAGIVDRMAEMGYGEIVIGVNVARSPNDTEYYKNLRAELWGTMREWFDQEMPVEIPNSDELHADLCSIGYKHTSSGQLQLESKERLKARGMPSPDCADALALTFYSGFYESDEGSIDSYVRPKAHSTMFT